MEEYNINLHKLNKLKITKNKLHTINLLLELKDERNNQYLKLLQDLLDDATKRYNIIVQKLSK